MAVDQGRHLPEGSRPRTIADGLRQPAADASNHPDAHPDGAVNYGPEQRFVQRPYPRREADFSPLRGCRVLVIDDDVQRGRGFAAHLAQRAAATRHHSGGDGLSELFDGRDSYDVILVSSEQVDDEDIEALGAVHGAPSVVLIGGPDRAEQLGLRAVPAAPTPGDLAVGVARALEARSLASENRSLRDQLDGRFSFGNIVTRDDALKGVLQVLESVAETRATVLILGETGTGKSLLARTLHQASDRRLGPYVEVNCGALPGGLLEAELFGHAKGSFTGATGDRPGRFEAADGGTIFLDEIDSAPLELQVKLLRVVQDRLFERVGESKTRQSDVRIVAATNASLIDRVADGSFREDLYWRLRVVEVSIPPLRMRPRDLAPLAEAFVERFAEEYGKRIRGIAPAALGALAAGQWPGNVRQLEHSLERAVLLSRGPGGVEDPGAPFRPLAATDLEPEGSGLQIAGRGSDAAPASGAEHALGQDEAAPLSVGLDWLERLVQEPISLKEALEGPEKLLIEHALRRNGGRRDRAASQLGVNRSTLFNKMRKYGLLDVNFADATT